MFGKDTPRVLVIRSGERLNDEQMKDAFAVGETVLWWRAIIQIIEDYRLTSADNGYSACGENNPMGTAAAVGAHDVLSNLLNDLSKRREQAMKQ